MQNLHGFDLLSNAFWAGISLLFIALCIAVTVILVVVAVDAARRVWRQQPLTGAVSKPAKK